MTTSAGPAGGAQQGAQHVALTPEQARGEVLTTTPQQQAAEQTLSDALRRMLDSVRAETIFGSPIEREGVTIIPCAEVMTGFGMGGGSGFGPTPTNQAERATTSAEGVSGGGGIGGGGGAQGRPVAVIAISQDGARVLPVVDITKLMLAGLTTVGFVTFWLTQVMARSRPLRPQAFSPTRFARVMRRAGR